MCLDSTFRRFGKKREEVERRPRTSRTKVENYRFEYRRGFPPTLYQTAKREQMADHEADLGKSQAHCRGVSSQVQMQPSAVLDLRLLHMLSPAGSDQWASRAGSKAAVMKCHLAR